VLSARAQPPGSSVLVVVDDASSADALLRWALYQAGRRHSSMNVLYAPAFPYDGDSGVVDPTAVEQGQKELTATLENLGVRSAAGLYVVGPEESTSEAIRARAVQGPYGFVMVGPLHTNTLVSLLFGSDSDGVEARPVSAVVVVPRSAWSTTFPRSTPSLLTVGFHGSNPAVGALAWAVDEANRRDGAVRAVMAWYEGDYGGLGGPVAIGARPSALVGRSADKIAADSLSRCGVPADRVRAVARRGMPASVLRREASGSDLLAVSAGQSTVFGRRTLGAVTLACVSRSPVPVVIVPSHAAGDEARSRASTGKGT
jgi:nucleotide-binding universal stress UspA family protein